MSAHAIARKPVPSSSSEVPRPPPKSEKQVRFAGWTESEGGPPAIPPTIPSTIITGLLRSGSPTQIERSTAPTECFDIPYPPDIFDPESDVLAFNIPSTPLSSRSDSKLVLPTISSIPDAELQARNNHIFAAATHLANCLTQLEVRLGGVDLILGLRQQASLSRFECQAFYNFLAPSDKEAFLVEQLPNFAARAHALASRTEKCNIRIPCIQVLDTSIGRGGGKDGKDPIRWERGEKDGPPSWRDMALGMGILPWVRRQMRVYAGPGGEKAMEDGVGGKVGIEQVALWEDLPGVLKGLVERPEGSDDEDGGNEGLRAVETGDDGGAVGEGEGSERPEAKTRGKGVENRVMRPGFLTLWHEMLRRDDVVLRKKEELVKTMRDGRERMGRGECRWCGEMDARPPAGRGGWLRRLRGW